MKYHLIGALMLASTQLTFAEEIRLNQSFVCSSPNGGMSIFDSNGPLREANGVPFFLRSGTTLPLNTQVHGEGAAYTFSSNAEVVLFAHDSAAQITKLSYQPGSTASSFLLASSDSITCKDEAAASVTLSYAADGSASQAAIDLEALDAELAARKNSSAKLVVRILVAKAVGFYDDGSRDLIHDSRGVQLAYMRSLELAEYVLDRLSEIAAKNVITVIPDYAAGNPDGLQPNQVRVDFFEF